MFSWTETMQNSNMFQFICMDYGIEMKLKILINVFLFVASILRKLISTWSRNITNLYYLNKREYVYILYIFV